MSNINWVTKYKFLSILGDAKEHDYSEIQYMASVLFSKTNNNWKNVFNKCLEWGLLERHWKAANIEGSGFSLSKKGDTAYREWSIRIHEREGNESYRYFKYYDRSAEALSNFSPDIKGI